MSEFTDQLRQPSGHGSLDDERRRAAEEIESLQAELDEDTADSARHLALLIQERQETTRLQTLLAGAKVAFQWPARLSVCWVAPDGHALGFYVDGKWAGEGIEDAWRVLGEKASGE